MYNPKFSGYSSTEWREKRLKILKRDNYTCQICGEYGDCIDHIVAWADRGDESLSNLQTTCKSCNSKKGSKCRTRLLKGRGKKPVNKKVNKDV